MLKLPPNRLLKALILPFFIFLLALPNVGISAENGFRSDLISIQLSDPATARQMPDAQFLHDKHTRTLTDKNCSKCHLKEENKFVFKFNRLKDAGYDADKKLYHEKCIGCHQEKREAGEKSGPLTSECRLCHSKPTAYRSSARPFGLNKSLHYRHEIAESIPSTAPSESKTDDKDWNCGVCHHEYDKKLNKTVYVKGKESTCRYCHKAVKTKAARSFRSVAHEQCLNCHYRLKSKNIKTGPVECGACHDAARQAKIQTIADVPRIQRNQPDTVLLSLWLKEAEKSKGPSDQFVKPVAFDHKTHEFAVATCYRCHHESMNACNDCHTRIGTEQSRFINLGTAMHTPQSMTSCIGCHDGKLKDKDCAGCHAQMTEKRFADEPCAGCHNVSRDLLTPIPANTAKTAQLAQSEINLWKIPQPVVPEDKIPKNVIIDVMKKQYQGATFPHRKIVLALSTRIQKSELATHFHGASTTLCTGCHHHSPASLTPPKCASCHPISPIAEPDGRPGLKGAYHVQCIRCHQEMGIEKPAATDCVACHKLQLESAQ